MAGWGSRLRPHTLTVPKPMVPIAGKSIVQRLVEDLAANCAEPVEEIVFIIRQDFGKEIEAQLLNISEGLKTKGRIAYQDVPLGTAHAILCAGDSLDGHVIVAFADTLFTITSQLNTEFDGVIYVQKVEDPSAFGVVKINENQVITDFVEKPKDFVSDLAIIGIYYFKDGKNLRSELQYLIDNNIMIKGEYQLTTALETIKGKGLKLVAGEVGEWLDCGNKVATVYTNQRILELVKEKETLVSTDAQIINSVIIPPVYIGKDAVIENAIVGPHVSIGAETVVKNSILRNSIIQSKSLIEDALCENSMIGNAVKIKGRWEDYSIGDYSVLS